ncbi:MAG: M1 family metallopeptidase [Bacteroidetes bacterium]|nr:M1 family metallopeptidase [Bacteroidota bacterium]
MKKPFFVVAFVICHSLFAIHSYAQSKTRSYINDPLLAPREHMVDFQHLKLEVSFEPTKNLVKGKVTHTFIPLLQKTDSIVLDGINMNIKEVSLNGKPAKFRSDSETVVIYTPSLAWEQKDSMTITYECTPRQGLYFIGWNDKTGICRRQIWSQGQGIENRNWIPMYDEMNDKIITEMFVIFDTAYKVLSNGKMIDKKTNKNGTYTWHYKMSHPHASYLIMLGIGKYEIDKRFSKSGVPVNLYYYPEWKDRVQNTYRWSENMIDFYEKEIGVPYQWESYSQIPVQDFMYGAMENTTATVFGDFFFCDERGSMERDYVSVNAHELAHQWFGDFITARSDAHHWLQESFATYYNWLFEREVFGKNHYDWGRRIAQNNSIEESKKNSYPIAHSEAGTVRHYPKGAFVLSMLKNILGGREVYNKCIKHYLETHPYTNVDSEDFLIACEEVTGIQLDWFWEEWIYKGGEPNYKVSFRDITENAGEKNSSHYSEFLVQQVQEQSEVTGLPQSGGNKTNAVNTDPFVQETDNHFPSPAGLWKMPIWFEVHYTDGTVEKKQVWIEKQTEIVHLPIPAGKKIDFALFDPDNEVLKSVSFNKSFDMLKSQAMKSVSLLDRYDALVAMEDIDIERKRDFLVAYYKTEDKANFHALKAEIVKQLSHDNNKQSEEIIKLALEDTDAPVRKSVLDNFKLLPEELLPSVEKLLKDPSYDIIATVLENLSFANPDKIGFYLEQTKDVEGMPGRNVKIKWLEISSLINPKYVDQLVSLCSDAYEFRTRTNAMNSLKKLNYLDEIEIEYLTNAMLSSNTRLSGPASDALSFFYLQSAYKRIIINYVESKEWKPWENKIIKQVVK